MIRMVLGSIGRTVAWIFTSPTKKMDSLSEQAQQDTIANHQRSGL